MKQKFQVAKNSHVYSRHKGMKRLAKHVNRHCIEKSHKQELVNQSKYDSEPIQNVNSVIHVNRFEVLANETDDLNNDVNCNASVLVEVIDKCECPTSQSVSVCTVVDNVHKCKNMSYLLDKKVE